MKIIDHDVYRPATWQSRYSATQLQNLLMNCCPALLRQIRASAILLLAVFISNAPFYRAWAGEDEGKTVNWPGWRGPTSDAVVQDAGLSGAGEGAGLSLVWKKPLGPGYTSVSVVNQIAVTGYSDGTNDRLAAFRTTDGERLWDIELDSTYTGHDGSHDGPISTPFLSDGAVYALSPWGRLVALNTSDGSEIWSTHLIEAQQAEKPHYGFASSPIVIGNTLILQGNGRDGNAVVGIDKQTGEQRWATGVDTVTYQSPMQITIAGQLQVMFVANKQLQGVDPANGNVLWTYDHQGDGHPRGSGSLNPVPAGEGRFYLTHKQREGSMVEIRKGGEQYVSEVLWSSPNFKMSYSTPVYHNGYLFGYNGRFLNCLDAQTGEEAWKSRKPGDGFLILLDDHLLIQTKKGDLHLAKASGSGYEEISSLKLFDDHSWSPASFAGGKIFARSMGEIAMVDVGNSAPVAATANPAAGHIAGTQFARFVEQVQGSNDKMAMIERFMAQQKDFPVIEDGRYVHLIYRGEVEDVVVTGDMIGSRHEERLIRIPETDFYYFSFELVPDARINYRYTINYEETIADSLNSRTIASINGPSSWVSMPKWTPAAHLEEAAEEVRGRLDSLSFESSIMEDTRVVDVYLPKGYDQGSERYPVAYVHWGDLAQSFGQMPTSLDNLVGNSVLPLIVVFMRPSPQSGNEFRGELLDKYSEMFTTEVVAAVDAQYRTLAAPEQRLSIGMGPSAYASLYSTVKHPGVIANVASQSMVMLTYNMQELLPHIKTAAEQPLKLYMDWGRYDLRSENEGWDFRRANQELRSHLESKGYAVHGEVVNDGWGWMSWKQRTNRVLETFFSM